MMNKDEVRSLFSYEDGNLLWKKNPRGRKSKTPIAGTINQSGYVVITCKGKKYHAHRLIWTYFHGWPEALLDHVNRNPLDNRIENLRLADVSSNSQNAKLRTDNSSGVKGVSWSNTYNKWVMQIYARGKKHQKLFKDFDEAVAYTNNLREVLHREFACTGGSV